MSQETTAVDPLIIESPIFKFQSALMYKRREILFHPGDSPHYLFFIVKGTIKLFRTHPDGKELITKIHVNGDFFGYESLLARKLYFETAYALEDSLIFKIPSDDFYTHFNSNQQIATMFTKILSSQIEEQGLQMIRLAYDSVGKRTAYALLYLHKISYQTETPNLFTISREDLGSLAGTATESVIRCLSQFKELGLIKMIGKQISVLDFEGLSCIS